MNTITKNLIYDIDVIIFCFLCIDVIIFFYYLPDIQKTRKEEGKKEIKFHKVYLSKMLSGAYLFKYIKSIVIKHKLIKLLKKKIPYIVYITNGYDNRVTITYLDTKEPDSICYDIVNILKLYTVNSVIVEISYNCLSRLDKMCFSDKYSERRKKLLKKIKESFLSGISLDVYIDTQFIEKNEEFLDNYIKLTQQYNYDK